MNGLAEKSPASRLVARPVLSLVPAVLFTIGFIPLLWVFFLNLWGRPHYQFFPLAIGGAGFLGWSRLKEVARPFEPGSRMTGSLCWALSFVLLCGATLLWSPWLGSIAALAGLIATIWTLGGGKLLRAMMPALFLMSVIIPPPLSLDTRLADSLRFLAVNWSSRLLDLCGVIHYRSGNVIELPRKTLLVEEACSGINSLLITMAGCLFYMLWRRATVWCTIVALFGSLSFVVLGNLFRITFGAWLKFHRDIDILSGWQHQAIGLLLFFSYLILIFSLERFLFFLTRPSRRRKSRRQHGGGEPAPIEPVRISSGLSPRWVRFAAVAFAILGMAAIGRGWTYGRVQAQNANPKSALRPDATFTLPGQLGHWTRLASASPVLQKVETLGVFSQVWHFQKNDLIASIALDYPFSGYHDVTICYTTQGWKMTERRASEVKDARGEIPCAEIQMENELGLQGSLWFSTVDERGQCVEMPVSERALLDRIKVSGRLEPTTYRLQVLVTSYAPLPEAERVQVKKLFEEARSLVWEKLAAQMRPR